MKWFVALVLLPVAVFSVGGAVWMLQHEVLHWGILLAILSLSVAGVLYFRRLGKAGHNIAIPEDQRSALDRAAYQLVDTHTSRLQELPADEVVDRNTQVQFARDLALELAQIYYPNAADPFDPVTPAELFSLVDFATHDAKTWLEYVLPGSSSVKIADWRRWTGPLRLDLRTAQSGRVVRLLLRRFGFYLIQLYSGRLSGQTAQPIAAGKPDMPDATNTQIRVDQVTIGVVGQNQTDIRTLIHDLLGPGRAIVDQWPDDPRFNRHRVQLNEPIARMVVLESGLTAIWEPSADADVWAGRMDAWLLVLSDLGDESSLDETVELLVQTQTPLIIVISEPDGEIRRLTPEPVTDRDRPSVEFASSMWELIRPFRRRWHGVVQDIIPVCLKLDRSIGIRPWLVEALVRCLDKHKAEIVNLAIEQGSPLLNLKNASKLEDQMGRNG